MVHAHLIYNPIAGPFSNLGQLSSSHEFVSRAAKRLEESGWKVELLETQSGEDIKHLAKIAADDKVEVVLVAGGDGTVGQALAGLYGSDTILGVLPSGTKNVWAREIGLQSLDFLHLLALEETADKLVRAPIYQVDVGLMNNKPFLLWSGMGFDAEIVHRMETNRTQSFSRQFTEMIYGVNAVQLLQDWKGIDLEISTDQGEKLGGRYLIGMATNIRSYAGGYAKLSSSAMIDDGVMDFWLVDETESVAQVFSHFFSLMSGKHQESEGFTQIPFKRLEIRSKHPIHCQNDGEPVGVFTEIIIEVKPRSQKVLIPDSSSVPLFSQNPVGHLPIQ
ncbi:MAG: diacylglycerol kinase family lipid kinase [Anaerolineales bacterium]|nr:diacylglycerol kinase family lipid kinase [Anaerolineales bacterium]